MAERRFLRPMSLGFPGSLIYVPRENPEDGPGSLETTRFTSRFPRFNIIGPLNTLYPPSKTEVSEPSSKLRSERRAQEQWLLKTHPEAFMGNTAFQDILAEDMVHFKVSEEVANDRPLLAIGHAPDVATKGETRMVPVMAVASGESGELLRLARIDDTLWQWRDNMNAFLNIPTPNPTNEEEEATWANDSLPILRVKFGGSHLQHEVHRWLLAQKQTSTTIFRPEYCPELTTLDEPKGTSPSKPPSFLNPNPLLSIHHKQTGGSAHSDAAFLPIVSSRSPQVAIIDECGYWSLWDLLGAWQVQKKKPPRPSLKKCGHISAGLLDELPSQPSYPAEKHGILVVGRVEVEQLRDTPSTLLRNGGTESVARHLLMWNREKIEVLDLESNISLPRLRPFTTQKGKPDLILDIQQSPVRQNHVFVLTKHHIIWIDIFGYNHSQEAMERPSVLLSCSLPGTKHDHARMFICRVSDDDADTSLVFIHCPVKNQLHVYWFTFSRESKIPQWHRDTISLPCSQEPHVRNFVQLLRVDPLKMAISTKDDAFGLGIDYDRRGVRFYQLSLLWDDLSLQHCVCAISDDPTLEITHPTTRVTLQQMELQREQQKRREAVMDDISSAFVIPDEMSVDRLNAVLHGKGAAREDMQRPHQQQNRDSHNSRPMTLKIGKLCQTLQQSLNLSVKRGETGLPSQLFDALRDALQKGLDEGKLPLLTWGEVVEKLVSSEKYESPENGMEKDVENLFDENSEQVVITQFRRHKSNDEHIWLLGLPYLRRYFYNLWIKPAEVVYTEEMKRVRQIWLSELARDVFLSNYGIMVQDTPLLGPASPEELEESQALPPSSQTIQSSLPSSAIKSSQTQSTASPGVDGAIQRLQLLCPSIRANKLDVSKQSKVLSYWPTERGVDPSNYVSSIAKANEELFKGARERLHKIEARHKARSEKYKRPAFMRQGLPNDVGRVPARPPPVQAMSSQVVPEASQSQAPFMTMSQPVPGAFGDRKKAKKAKKKSGFR